MAIGVLVLPTVIASGYVTSIQDRTFRNGDDAGKRYGFQVTLSQESGAQVRLNINERVGDNADNPLALLQAEIPSMGQFWPVLAQVSESREYGASLRYAGSPVSELDKAHSALVATKG